MRISDLNRPQNKLEPVEGTIYSVGTPKTVNLKSGDTAVVCEAVLRDSSGDITLKLWDAQVKMVRPGSEILIENGYITEFKGKVSLNIGKFGKLKVIKF